VDEKRAGPDTGRPRLQEGAQSHGEDRRCHRRLSGWRIDPGQRCCREHVGDEGQRSGKVLGCEARQRARRGTLDPAVGKVGGAAADWKVGEPECAA